MKRTSTNRLQLAVRLRLEPVEDRTVPSPPYGDLGTPLNLGPVVNSSSSDQHPAISKDGLSLYITTNRPEFEDDLVRDDNIWVSHRASTTDPWSAPVELGPGVNTSANDRVPTFSRDGHWMFFGSNRSGGSGGLDVWASFRNDVHDDFAWLPAVNLGTGINSPSDDDGPTYFQDDETGVATLIFTSNRPGGVGDFDIYTSARMPDDTYGPAVLIPELSSIGRDTRSAIRHDGRELFLTSNRAGSQVNPATGIRSLDLWVSQRESPSEPWGLPTNLGEIVNSPADDGAPALSSDAETLYFYSNRLPSFGGNDLYETRRSKENSASTQRGSISVQGLFPLSDHNLAGFAGDSLAINRSQNDTVILVSKPEDHSPSNSNPGDTDGEKVGSLKVSSVLPLADSRVLIAETDRANIGMDTVKDSWSELRTTGS